MKTVDANEIYDKSSFKPFHLSIIVGCFLIILFDGFDTAIYGAVVPVLMEEWSLTPVQTGAIGSYTVIGTVVGAVGMSIIGDRIGPKVPIAAILREKGLLARSCFGQLLSAAFCSFMR